MAGVQREYSYPTSNSSTHKKIIERIRALNQNALAPRLFSHLVTPVLYVSRREATIPGMSATLVYSIAQQLRAYVVVWRSRDRDAEMADGMRHLLKRCKRNRLMLWRICEAFILSGVYTDFPPATYLPERQESHSHRRTTQNTHGDTAATSRDVVGVTCAFFLLIIL